MITAKSVSQTYRSVGRSLTVLHPLDLEIRERDFVAIVGPSGSGKTTLLGLLAGLDLPATGTVAIDGQDLGAMTEDQRAELRAAKIGFVFQSFQLLPTLTALENVMVPLELQAGRLEVNHIEAHARDLLARVGLAERVDHYPIQLSGGEQQRVAIARAFANNPKILFADEPTGNLDAENGQHIVDLLVSMNRERQTTLVLVTHDRAVASCAQQIVRLEGGKLVRDSQ